MAVTIFVRLAIGTRSSELRWASISPVFESTIRYAFAVTGGVGGKAWFERNNRSPTAAIWERSETTGENKDSEVCSMRDCVTREWSVGPPSDGVLSAKVHTDRATAKAAPIRRVQIANGTISERFFCDSDGRRLPDLWRAELIHRLFDFWTDATKKKPTANRRGPFAEMIATIINYRYERKDSKGDVNITTEIAVLSSLTPQERIRLDALDFGALCANRKDSTKKD